MESEDSSLAQMPGVLYVMKAAQRPEQRVLNGTNAALSSFSFLGHSHRFIVSIIKHDSIWSASKTVLINDSSFFRRHLIWFIGECFLNNWHWTKTWWITRYARALFTLLRRVLFLNRLTMRAFCFRLPLFPDQRLLYFPHPNYYCKNPHHLMRQSLSLFGKYNW